MNRNLDQLERKRVKKHWSDIKINPKWQWPEAEHHGESSQYEKSLFLGMYGTVFRV